MKIKYPLSNLLLRKARIINEFSQGEVATMLGYSCAQFVSNCERNLCFYKMGDLKKLCKFLGIEESNLIATLKKDFESTIQEAIFYGK